MAALEMNLLGPMEARLNGRPVAEVHANRKVGALLAYLAVEGHRLQRRETLIGLLWPGMPERSARHNLSQTLYMLKGLFPELDAREGPGRVPLVLANRQGVGLNADAALVVDVQRFKALLEDPASLREADA